MTFDHQMLERIERQKFAEALANPVDSVIMPARIEKQIDFLEMPRKWKATPTMIECWIVGQLKEAGMPVEGTLFFRGLTTGKLTAYDSPETGMRHFIWEA